MVSGEKSSGQLSIMIECMPENSFAWWLDRHFSVHQLNLINTAAADLAVCLDGMTAGRGQGWVASHTHGTRIHHGGLFTKIAARNTGLPTSIVLPYRDIWLWPDFDRFHLPKRHFLHELGHVVENNLPKSFLSPPTIFGGGASDRLTRFLGGKPVGLRYKNGTCGIQERFIWHGVGEYGNNSSADYFAEAFSWLPYNLAALPDALIAEWFINEIFQFSV
jgi:hypothetical protein